MRSEIISVGTELLLGQIVDTNAAFLSTEMAARGIDVLFRSTVGDNAGRLADCLRLALARADIVITIGGLGPTEDDLTKETVSEISGISLINDPPSEQTIRAFFERRGIPLAQCNLKQALKPAKGIAVANPNGTAPGAIFDLGRQAIICLPGPPAELIPMWNSQVLGWLSAKGFTPNEVIRSRVLRFVGIGESLLEDKIKDMLSGTNPTVAPLAHTGEVHLRITAKANSEQDASELIFAQEAALRQRVGEWIYGVDDQTLESVVVQDCVMAGIKIATAESCTGGLIASRITDVPGSSRTFLEGLICYSNEAKTDILGVPAGLIEQHGAVSEQVAIAMAKGALRKSGADIAISDTGIAGPGGGSEEKPVGLVWIGAATMHGTHAERNLFAGDRLTIKRRASQAALSLLRGTLKAEFNNK